MRCEIEGCGQIAQLTARKDDRIKRVCTDCGSEMQALMGWSIIGLFQREKPKRHLTIFPC